MGRGRLAANVDSLCRVMHSGDGQMCLSYVAMAARQATAISLAQAA